MRGLTGSRVATRVLRRRDWAKLFDLTALETGRFLLGGVFEFCAEK